MLDDTEADGAARGAALADGAGEALLQEIFRHGRLQVTQRAVVDIDSGVPVAVRVLTSGVDGRAEAGPAELHRLIARSEHVASLDDASRGHALAAHRRQPLVEGAPVVLDAHLASFAQLGPNDEPTMVVLMVDATEVLERPAGALRLVAAARGLGWAVGLRDIGATPTSVAAVAVVEPVLMVLAPSVPAAPTSALALEAVQATTAFAQVSGAAVAVHDVADAATEADALAVGASLASGPLYEQRRLVAARAPHPEIRLTSPTLAAAQQSPFEIAARRHPTRRATQSLLAALSRRLEQLAAGGGPSTLLLSAFQHVDNLTPSTRERYAGLGQRCGLVMVAARGLRESVAPGVSVAALDGSDPLVREWDVLVLTPTTGAMLVASDRRVPEQPEDEREFDYVLCFDRDLVAHAVRAMLGRLTHRAAPDRAGAAVG